MQFSRQPVSGAVYEFWSSTSAAMFVDLPQSWWIYCLLCTFIQRFKIRDQQYWVTFLTSLFCLPQSLFSVRNLVRTEECAWASTGAVVQKDLLEISVKQVGLCALMCVCVRGCKSILCLHFALRLLMCLVSTAVTTPCVPPCQHGATCSPHNTCTCPEGTAGLRCERL